MDLTFPPIRDIIPLSAYGFAAYVVVFTGVLRFGQRPHVVLSANVLSALKCVSLRWLVKALENAVLQQAVADPCLATDRSQWRKSPPRQQDIDPQRQTNAVHISRALASSGEVPWLSNQLW